MIDALTRLSKELHRMHVPSCPKHGAVNILLLAFPRSGPSSV